MADILIKGVEMPEEGNWKTIRIYPTGECAIPNWQGDCTIIKGAKAIHVPDHGRLIDAQKFAAVMHERYNNAYSWYMEAEDPEIKFRAASVVASVTECSLILSKMPTVIPAEPQKGEM